MVIKRQKLLLVRLHSMGNYQVIELTNSELVSIDGGWVGPCVLYGGALYLAYELGHAAGQTLYYVTH